MDNKKNLENALKDIYKVRSCSICKNYTKKVERKGNRPDFKWRYDDDDN